MKEPIVLRHDHPNVICFGGGHHTLGLRQIAGERLLDDHVLPGGNGLFHIGRVEMAGGEYSDRITRRRFHRLSQRAEAGRLGQTADFECVRKRLGNDIDQANDLELIRQRHLAFRCCRARPPTPTEMTRNGWAFTADAPTCRQ